MEIFEVEEVMVENRFMVKHFLMKHLLLNIINEVFLVSIHFFLRVSLLLLYEILYFFFKGMANKGYRHSNGSQFYITLSDACQWMSNRFVAFGRVVEGFDTLDKLEHIDTINQRPIKAVKIINCGTVILPVYREMNHRNY